MKNKYPSTPTGYYVYQLCHFDGLPFYIGYGKGDRAVHHEQYARGERGLGYGLTEDYNPFKTRTIQKIISEGRSILYKFELFETADAAKCREIELISLYGRRGIDAVGILTNRTKGGDGGYTWAHRRDEVAAKQRLTWSDPAKRRAMSKKVKETKQSTGTWAQPWDPDTYEIRAQIARVNGRTTARPVAQIDRETGKVIKVWDTGTDAAIAFGMKSPGAIAAAAGGYQKTAGGFRWSYNLVDQVLP